MMYMKCCLKRKDHIKFFSLTYLRFLISFIMSLYHMAWIANVYGSLEFLEYRISSLAISENKLFLLYAFLEDSLTLE